MNQLCYDMIDPIVMNSIQIKQELSATFVDFNFKWENLIFSIKSKETIENLNFDEIFKRKKVMALLRICSTRCITSIFIH